MIQERFFRKKARKKSPSENLAKPGDYIVAFNCQTVSTKKELMADLRETDGQKMYYWKL